MTKTLGEFKLTVESGGFSNCEIIVLLGENGTGKSTLVTMLAGKQKPDDVDTKLPELSISVKPQSISPKFEGTVQELLSEKLGEVRFLYKFNNEIKFLKYFFILII
jgi:ATP-binding cassette subfamily E protein 1